MQRRLAAVLAADVVGYSRLMGEDEAQTLAALAELRKTLFEPLVATRGGIIAKRMGDGWIIEYTNVSDAVANAIEIQQSLSSHAIIQLRIGVHVGDITRLDDDVYGDGVNVAARLEAIAEPGQILISDTAYNSLDGKAARQFVGGDSRQLKNISRPVTIWRWPASSAPPEEIGEDNPSIAILAFENRTADDDMDFFAEGLAEDILTVLSRTAGLFVIARDSSFSYKNKEVDSKQIGQELGVRHILEGSVRRAGDRIRISAKLTDTQTGSPIWAEIYNRTMDDVFDLQDDITKEIVIALQGKFTAGEMATWMGRGTKNIEAWRLAGEADELIQRFNLADTKLAQDLLRQATEADPNYAFAWGKFAISLWFEARINTNADVDAIIAQARDCSNKAMAIDASEPWSFGSAGMVLCFLGKHEEALAITREGVAKNLGSAEARAIYSFCLGFAGKIEEAIQTMEEAIRLNPLHPDWYLTNLPRLYDQVDRTDEAIALAEEALRRQPILGSYQLFLASAYGRQGRLEDAREMASRFVNLTPNFTVNQAGKYLMKGDLSYLEKFTEGLIKAGLPE